MLVIFCIVVDPCRNAKELLRVGLHWRVPFIEDLSETVQLLSITSLSFSEMFH